MEPDRFSRHRRSEDSEDEGKGEKEAEDWVDEALGCGIWVAEIHQRLEEEWVRVKMVRMEKDMEGNDKGIILEGKGREGMDTMRPYDDDTRQKNMEVTRIRNFLETL